jgi:hypothetical protein
MGGAIDQGVLPMLAQPIAVQMAALSTHRYLNDARSERAPRPRRATARVLQALAVRRDPALVRKPQLS